MTITAKVIADSIANDIRLTTLELEYPRFIHSEFMTHRMFCLDGDSLLEFDLPKGQGEYKRVFTMTLREFAYKWFNGDSKGRSLRHRLSNMRIRQLNESTQKIETCTVRDCFISGGKEVFEITAGGMSVAGSKDHRILTVDGWKRIEELEVDKDYIITRAFGKLDEDVNDPIRLKKFGDNWKSTLLQSIKSLGHKETFDLEMDSEYENFIANGIVVHNSRNASSSRAIPVNKMIEKVRNDPAMPIHWGRNQKGMQADEELNIFDKEQAIQDWRYGALRAVDVAIRISELEIHKQIVNRLTEPFQHIKVIVTATEWDNFFKLRLHPDAQPEIQELARCIRKAMDYYTPIELERGEWHLPYVVAEDCVKTTTDNFVKLSVARCARVSYLNHDNENPDIDKDIALADRLLEAGHMSPFEHQATPMDFAKDTYELTWEKGVTHRDRKDNLWSANFRGWIMYRKLLDV